MVSGQYDWRKSERAFKIFKEIYFNTMKGKKDTTVKELMKKCNRKHSVISRQVSCLKKAGIVNGERKGKYKYLTIDINKLIDMIGVGEGVVVPDEFTMAAVTFDSFIKQAKEMTKVIREKERLKKQLARKK